VGPKHENSNTSALDQLIDTTQDAVIFIDGGGLIRRFNASAEKIFGYSAKEVYGHNVSMLMPEPYREHHDAYIHRYEETGEAKAIGRIREVAARRKDGEVFPIELSVTPMAGTAQEEVRYAAFIRDMSEHVRLQQELLEGERLAAIGTTAATFAHEIGNPLNAMFMNAQLLERRLKREAPNLSERVTSRVTAIAEETERMNCLLREFRALSRRQGLEMTQFKLVEYLETLLDHDKAIFEAARVRIRIDAEPAELEIEADRSKLAQVFLNLTKNAVEAMPEGGTLGVAVAAVDEGVRIEVSDTGHGIDDGIDVFAPFATTKQEGTGLGLPVVHRIVAAHGGQIRYVTQVGEGTTFIVELPLRPPGD
jgi:two-component system sensor kinase FixL